MPEQRRIGYRWNFCALMAKRNLWKTTELMPLLRSRGINLSESQVYGWSRPRRNASRPGRSRRSATSWTARRTTCSNNSLRCVPRRQPTHSSEDLGIQPANPIAKRIRLVTPEDGE